MIQCHCNIVVFHKSSFYLIKISLICYFFDLIVKNLRFTRSQNGPNFGMKYSKSLPQSQLYAFSARNLTYSHVLIGTPASISQFLLQAPLTQFLDPAQYMSSGELT